MSNTFGNSKVTICQFCGKSSIHEVDIDIEIAYSETCLCHECGKKLIDAIKKFNLKGESNEI